MKTVAKNRVSAFLALAVALFGFAHFAAAEKLTTSEAYGYKVYFQHHPPQDKPVKHNLYPHKGPIIQAGQDIPVCAAARTAGAYAKKTELRYLLHGKDGWLFRTIDFRSDFTASPKTLEYFTRLNRALSARGQTLVVAFQPTRGMMGAQFIDIADAPKDYDPAKARRGYKAFLRQLEESGIRVVDLSGSPDPAAYFPKGDFHWTPEGANYSAAMVADALKDIPAYKDIKKQDFITEISGMGPADRGAFEEFIQKTCQVNIELTTEPVWSTMPVQTETASADSLLGDEVFPAITVLGASNSSEDGKFNFVGALKRHARADVYNAAITGGGFGSAAYRYYASDEYRLSPPKIIVWEFLPQHNYNNAESIDAFRQMIPAIHGACSAKDARAQHAGEITRGQTPLFSALQDVSLKDAYLYLEVTEPAERSLKLEVLYKNGDADQVELTRSTRAANNGKYFLELGEKADKGAILFHLITDIPQGKLAARICQYPVQVVRK